MTSCSGILYHTCCGVFRSGGTGGIEYAPLRGVFRCWVCISIHLSLVFATQLKRRYNLGSSPSIFFSFSFLFTIHDLIVGRIELVHSPWQDLCASF